MQPASNVSFVSSRKTLREGQQLVVDAVMAALDTNCTVLPVQLPTGYGKTLTAAAVFAAALKAGRIDRLLYLVPTSIQLAQFCSGGHEDSSRGLWRRRSLDMVSHSRQRCTVAQARSTLRPYRRSSQKRRAWSARSHDRNWCSSRMSTPLRTTSFESHCSAWGP